MGDLFLSLHPPLPLLIPVSTDFRKTRWVSSGPMPAYSRLALEYQEPASQVQTENSPEVGSLQELHICLFLKHHLLQEASPDDPCFHRTLYWPPSVHLLCCAQKYLLYLIPPLNKPSSSQPPLHAKNQSELCWGPKHPAYGAWH